MPRTVVVTTPSGKRDRVIPGRGHLTVRELGLCDKFALSREAIAREVPTGEFFGDFIASRLPRLERGLEVACGAGAVASRIEPAPVLTDVDPRRIAHAAARTGLPPGPACSAESLPFAKASFDVVLMVRVLHVSASPRQAIQEARRVLALDGVVAVGFTLPGPPDVIDVAMAPLFPHRLRASEANYVARLAAAFESASFNVGQTESIGRQERSESPSAVANAVGSRLERDVDDRTRAVLESVHHELTSLPNPGVPIHRPLSLNLMLAWAGEYTE